MAKKLVTKAAAIPEIVEPENPTVALVRTDAGAVTRWAENALQFFKGATDLELAAKARLMRMEGLTVPTNGSQDAQVQDLIRLSNAGKKETTDYWYITGIFDKLHKLAVQGRKRAVDADEQAAQIGNRLHTTYTEAERRRAQAEEDRLRREAEERARADRQRELDALEAAALKAEASSPTLSEREEAFVRFIAAERTPFDAARHAGYKDPGVMGPRLLSTAKILKAIEARRQSVKLREQAVAVQTAPVLVEDVEVRPDIQKGGDRTTFSADIFDPIAYREAIISGVYHLSHALLVPDPVAANKLAQSLREQINRIPGIRLRRTTCVV